MNKNTMYKEYFTTQVNLDQIKSTHAKLECKLPKMKTSTMDPKRMYAVSPYTYSIVTCVRRLTIYNRTF